MASDNPKSMGDEETLRRDDVADATASPTTPSVGSGSTLAPDGEAHLGRVDRYLLKERVGQGAFGAVGSIKGSMKE